MDRKITTLAIAAVALWGCGESSPTPPQPKPPVSDRPPAEKEEFGIYLGNPHAHCFYSGDAKDKSEQNSPENHFALARQNGYDFYAITDHSQYDEYAPEAWEHIGRAAERATASDFVAMRGYEHSENNGPGAKGHMNVYGSPSYLDALEAGVDMPYFQNWLTERANSGAVASMNHPGAGQYDDFACYNEGAREKITIFETINVNNDHYDRFVTALSRGWMLSPVAGCDNHGWQGIAKWVPRTGVAAKSLTRESLLEAMRARRTYSTWDTDLEAIYYVDNFPMGSRFAPGDGQLKFDIVVSDPTNEITKVEIVAPGDRVVVSKSFSSNSVEWSVGVEQGGDYYYVKIYNASREGAVAVAAPVWLRHT
jgi:predicted metal-dependent phosphoesterase TrpH